VGIIGFIVSLVAGGFMIIGLIPYLGIINWFTTLPAAIAGAVFSAIGMSRRRSGVAVAGFIISIAVFFIALVRLMVGHGII
jgi:hypothetical protein